MFFKIAPYGVLTPVLKTGRRVSGESVINFLQHVFALHLLHCIIYEHGISSAVFSPFWKGTSSIIESTKPQKPGGGSSSKVDGSRRAWFPVGMCKVPKPLSFANELAKGF